MSLTTVVFNPFTGTFDYVSCERSCTDGLITQYSEATGVASGVTTLIGSYTAAARVVLSKINFSGTNIAEYELLIDGVTIDKKRTYFGASLNDVFDFKSGLVIQTGQVVQLFALHTRPMLGDFNSTLQILES